MDLSSYKQQMDKAVSHLTVEFKSIQVGRASIGMLENVNVETSYGIMKAPQLAHITLMDGRTLKVEPWDKKELKAVEKAVYDSNLGLTPKNEGSYILIRVPEVTQERRQELVKTVKHSGEEVKAQIRRIRQDAQKESKKLYEDKEISQDEHKLNESEIDDLTKAASLEVDNLVAAKGEDVMKI